jgi:hypothetical protein
LQNEFKFLPCLPVAYTGPLNNFEANTRRHITSTVKTVIYSPALTPVILATQEAEVRRIAVGSQPGEIVLETLS